MIRALSVLLVNLVLAVPARADDPLARLEALLAATRTWEAQFEQTVFDESGRPTQDSRGTVYLYRPDRFRWDYRAPSPQVIVADGTRIWVYDEELEQVTVRPMDQALGNTPALLLMNRGDIEEVFTATTVGRRDGLDWVELAPRAESAAFERLRLGLDPNQIRVMEMTDSFGQTTELRFSDARTNVELDPALFRFTPPPGVDVIQGK